MSIIKEAYEFIKRGRSEGVAPFTMEYKLKGANIREGDYKPLYFSDERLLFCFKYIPWTDDRYLKLQKIAKRYNLEISKDSLGIGYSLLRNGKERMHVTDAEVFVMVPPDDEQEKLLKEIGSELFYAKSK